VVQEVVMMTMTSGRNRGYRITWWHNKIKGEFDFFAGTVVVLSGVSTIFLSTDKCTMYIKQIELLNTNNERRVGENENQFLPITTCKNKNRESTID
jgi:hypothetical protein|tara:strand:- start:84 stop:371 length:288 start_codon:yes stop_codon:yes gene_type:complete